MDVNGRGHVPGNFRPVPLEADEKKESVFHRLADRPSTESGVPDGRPAGVDPVGQQGSPWVC